MEEMKLKNISGEWSEEFDPERPGWRKPEPAYIGKNFLQIWWLYRRKWFNMSFDRYGLRCSFIPSPGKSVFCGFRGLVCVQACSYLDEILTNEIIQKSQGCRYEDDNKD